MSVMRDFRELPSRFFCRLTISAAIPRSLAAKRTFFAPREPLLCFTYGHTFDRTLRFEGSDKIYDGQAGSKINRVHRARHWLRCVTHCALPRVIMSNYPAIVARWRLAQGSTCDIDIDRCTTETRLPFFRLARSYYLKQKADESFLLLNAVTRIVFLKPRRNDSRRLGKTSVPLCGRCSVFTRRM